LPHRNIDFYLMMIYISLINLLQCNMRVPT
jgi:hypothetical protein